MPVPWAQEAVIAHLDESVRQDVLQKPADELFGTHRTARELLGCRILILKRDGAILKLEDALIADGHAKDVRSEVSEGFLATADGLAVHDPVLAPGALIHAGEQGGLFQVIAELGPEDHGEGLHVE